MLTLFVGNSTVLELQNVTNTVTGVVDEGAAVSATLYDGAGVAVTGELWPVTLTHASGGTYRRTLSGDLSVRPGGVYYAIVEATGSGGEEGRWEGQVKAQPRKQF